MGQPRLSIGRHVTFESGGELPAVLPTLSENDFTAVNHVRSRKIKWLAVSL